MSEGNPTNHNVRPSLRGRADLGLLLNFAKTFGGPTTNGFTTGQCSSDKEYCATIHCQAMGKFPKMPFILLMGKIVNFAIHLSLFQLTKH
jgi:hypothetical protein